MLKKIVKYGNSSALILDKALLELLDMAEGSIVKIKTDGVSLIITPQQPVTAATVTPTPTIESAFNEATKQCLAQSYAGDTDKAAAFQQELEAICARYKQRAEEKKDQPEQQALIMAEMNREMDSLMQKYPVTNAAEWGSFDMQAATAAFADVHQKYQHLQEPMAALMASPEYIHEMALLAEKYQYSPDGLQTKEYLDAFTAVIARSIPEYAAYQSELRKIGEKYTPATTQKA